MRSPRSCRRQLGLGLGSSLLETRPSFSGFSYGTRSSCLSCALSTTLLLFSVVIVLHVYLGSLGNWISATTPAHRAKCSHTKGKIPQGTKRSGGLLSLVDSLCDFLLTPVGLVLVALSGTYAFV